MCVISRCSSRPHHNICSDFFFTYTKIIMPKQTTDCALVPTHLCCLIQNLLLKSTHAARYIEWLRVYIYVTQQTPSAASWILKLLVFTLWWSGIMSESPVDYNTHRERCLFYSWCAARRLASKDAASKQRALAINRRVCARTHELCYMLSSRKFAPIWVCWWDAHGKRERSRERVLMQRKEDPLATCVGDVNFLLQLAGGITKSPF